MVIDFLKWAKNAILDKHFLYSLAVFFFFILLFDFDVVATDERYEWEETCGASSCSWHATYNNGQQTNTIMELNNSKCNILSSTEAECYVISEQTNWDYFKETCPRYIHPYDKVKITLNPDGFSKEIIELGNIPEGCKK